MTISKKTLAGIGVVIVAAVVAAYFVFFSSKSSSIKFDLSSTSLASNATETVAGSVTPAEADRVVVIESKAPGANWVEVDRVATDAVGKFALTMPMKTVGKWQVRASVESKGRQSDADASSQSVKVLDPTQISAQIPRFARADKAFRISGLLSPSGDRSVTVESSTDGQTFTPAAQATVNSTSGHFTALVRGLKAGTVSVRVAVTESDQAAAGASPTKSVIVEDYKAAGQHYLKIVKPANALLNQLDTVRYNHAKYVAVVAKLSTAFTKEARQFRQYAYWPQEVKKNIAILAKTDILYADFYNRLSKTKTAAATYNVGEPTYPKGSDSAAALVRAALGLPKRT